MSACPLYKLSSFSQSFSLLFWNNGWGSSGFHTCMGIISYFKPWMVSKDIPLHQKMGSKFTNFPVTIIKIQARINRFLLIPHRVSPNSQKT
jgi:hypothetical protein